MARNSFNLLRHIAAILVVYGHAYPLSGNGTIDKIQEISRGVFPSAQIGVFIFFSISGYLIAISLERSSSYINFLWKRFLRIMPGLAVCLIFIMLIIGPISTVLSTAAYFSSPQTYAFLKALKIFPDYPNYLPGVFETLPVQLVNGSLWTLAYEVTLYVILMTLHIAFGKRTKSAVLVMIILLWSSFFVWHGPVTSWNQPLRIIHLNLGELINFGLYFFIGSASFYFRNILKFKSYYMLAGLGILMFVYWLSSTMNFIPLSSIVWIRYMLLPYIIFYIALQFDTHELMDGIGDLSYGIYIYSFPIQQFLQLKLGAYHFSSEIMFLIALLVIVPVAVFSWRWVENPALQYKMSVK
ncbi:acyltransferase family protein [Dyadobacter sediminis]|uniref:Acyltransferase n=1 Tax=Dyadobacter sediminis TaxID=1493691 RepID=A0A5R9KJV8_9BACT|nr:acyltransferase [Dyadobacter sediminis]TLU96409.1 acyltransferase [Dyadobacter sediminis]GGB82007.1 acyltransferase [Dyadobacter sediminis]